MAQPYYFDSEQNKKIVLGAKLGSGGEGDVFHVQGFTDVVAKIYHAFPDIKTIAKLSAMVANKDPKLHKFTAWPLALLLDQSDQVCGFLMSKIEKCQAIHNLYNPGDRKKNFPKADWHFLVHVARNLAAAFAYVHQNGYIVGDVNQGNVMVSMDGKLHLIDCDSFQISSNAGVYLCEVGVSHFTPPELLKLSSFKGVTRSQNHDNFGLAILLFHLLFMGRHPFSGISSSSEEITIEQAIKEYRFAFSKVSSSGLKPPSRSLPLDMLPAELACMFEDAFTRQNGSPNERPSAGAWLQALDVLKGKMATCGKNKSHTYSAHLSYCPWCYAEQKFASIFFPEKFAPITPTSSSETEMDENISMAYNMILQVSPISAEHKIDPNAITRAATMPQQRSPKSKQTMWRCGVGAIGLAIIAVTEIPFWIVGGVACLIMAKIPSQETGQHKQAKAEKERAQQEWKLLEIKWNTLITGHSCDALQEAVSRLKNDYDGLGSSLQHRKQYIFNQRRQALSDQFLRQFDVARAIIPSIGTNRKRMLYSAGIRTAADVSRSNLYRVNGFGSELCGKVEAWRRSLEHRFSPPAHLTQQVEQEIALIRVGEKRRIEREILNASNQLLRRLIQVESARKILLQELQTAAINLAQAEANYKAVFN